MSICLVITGSMASGTLWHLPRTRSHGHVACIQALSIHGSNFFSCQEICSDFPLGALSLSHLHCLLCSSISRIPRTGGKKSPFILDQAMVIFLLISMAQLFFFLPYDTWYLLSTCIPKFPDIKLIHKAFYEALNAL